MNTRTLSKIAGISYLVIFFSAIFANFYALDSLSTSPMETVKDNPFIVRMGIIAFLITVVFDVVVAWALKELYKHHYLSNLSTYFRMMHAAIMGVAIYALAFALQSKSQVEILKQVDTFNLIWLIGLFFFGIHLILLSRIAIIPKFIKFFLGIAGFMYVADTLANFLLLNYSEYAELFLLLVALPSILGELSLTVWLLFKGGKTNP